MAVMANERSMNLRPTQECDVVGHVTVTDLDSESRGAVLRIGGGVRAHGTTDAAALTALAVKLHALAEQVAAMSAKARKVVRCAKCLAVNATPGRICGACGHAIMVSQ